MTAAAENAVAEKSSIATPSGPGLHRELAPTDGAERHVTGEARLLRFVTDNSETTMPPDWQLMVGEASFSPGAVSEFQLPTSVRVGVVAQASWEGVPIGKCDVRANVSTLEVTPHACVDLMATDARESLAYWSANAATPHRGIKVSSQELEEGRARLILPCGKPIRLSVFSPTGGVTALGLLSLNSWEVRIAVVDRHAPGAVISGLVTDTTGLPVADCPLRVSRIYPVGESDSDFMILSAEICRLFGGVHEVVSTNAKGKFEVRHSEILDRVPVLVDVNSPDYRATESLGARVTWAHRGSAFVPVAVRKRAND